MVIQVLNDISRYEFIKIKYYAKKIETVKAFSILAFSTPAFKQVDASKSNATTSSVAVSPFRNAYHQNHPSRPYLHTCLLRDNGGVFHHLSSY